MGISDTICYSMDVAHTYRHRCHACARKSVVVRSYPFRSGRFFSSSYKALSSGQREHNTEYTPTILTQADIIPVVIGTFAKETVREHALLCYA